MKPIHALGLVFTLVVSASGCGGSQSTSNAATNDSAPPAPVAASVIYAVDTANTLYTLKSDRPGNVTTIGTISGMKANDSIVAITASPEQVLFGLGSSGVLYEIHSDASTLGLSGNTGTDPQFTPQGSFFGLSFLRMNPYDLRLTSDTGFNGRVNPGNGTLESTDTRLAYASGDAHFGSTPHLITSASSCGCGGVIPTIYGIDDHTGAFVTVGSINGIPSGAESGLISTVGSLGISIASGSYAALSLPTDQTVAYATISGTSGTTLYKIDLGSGAASVVGAVSVANPIRTAVILPTN